MKGVFLDRATIDESIDVKALESCLSKLDYFATTSDSEKISRADKCEVLITNKVIIDRETIESLPYLKLICVTATGTNNVDLQAARDQSIAVTNVAGYSTFSVAQHVFAYLLNYNSQVVDYLHLNQSSPWNLSKTFCQIPTPIHQLSAQVLGVVGFGNIGKTVARIGESFGMEVVVAERPGVKEIREGRVSFENMLKCSDVISLHCPLTEQTQNLFDDKVLRQMKPGAVLVNTSRGPIVDSKALAEALKSGRLGHAIIDVLEEEPPSASHPLQTAVIPNLTLTHHIAWGSIEAQQTLMDGVAKNIEAFIRGDNLNRVV